MKQRLWQPSKEAIANSQMTQFIDYINQNYPAKISDYFTLHQWSIDNPEAFWSSVWDFGKVIASKKAQQILVDGNHMETTKWFVDAKLNFAENLLRRRDDHTALVFVSENGQRNELTYAKLFHQVAVLAEQLREYGIKAGDRVAAFMPNSPETIIAMLATTSIGAVWSSCSADFGLQGLLDRFSQIEPKILFATDGHQYKGKTFNHLEKIAELQKQLPSLQKTIVLPFINDHTDISHLNNALLWTDIKKTETPELIFEQLPFNHPIYILYSSGTTGKPKCMVHGAGGILLQHLKELMLHTDLRPEDKIFFFTTCGWMMWNWLVSSLAVGATVVLYEGSPFYPNPKRLFDLIDEIGITVFGVGAKLIEAAHKARLIPMKTHDLSTLRTIATTASPLLPESFDYVYTKIKKDLCLSSISGGSDIVSCFALGNPILPVYRGELQCMGLGMNVKVFNDEGQSVTQEKGELVCISPFTAMPIYFWNDPDGKKLHNAYFDKFPNVWAHGDYAEITKHNGMIIYGRSDTTLNPGGLRIGTAEIYRQLDKIDDVIDCMAVAQNWESSERIILFVVLREGISLNDDLRKNIKTMIRHDVSPHHVPAKIIQVPDLPRTINGKIVELAVKKVIHGEPVKNLETLANPETLDYFRDLKELMK